jgi:hypothetical protein
MKGKTIELNSASTRMAAEEAIDHERFMHIYIMNLRPDMCTIEL